MIRITDGCKTASDVLEKKSSFQLLLKKHEIEVDNYKDYYNERNFRYNIENSNFEVNQMLNYINILRKGKNSGRLIEIGHILLTGKNIILQQAWDIRLKDNLDIPRASTLDYMTERFWFILNKGFGINISLTSFDIIRKAKIAMASVVSSGIREKYENLSKKFTDGEYSTEQIANIIVNLRKENKLPEEINSSNIDIILNILDENDIARIQNESIIKEKKYTEVELKNREQNNVIEQTTDLLNKKNKIIDDLECELREYKMNELLEKKRIQMRHEKQRKVLLTIVIVIVSFTFCFLLFKYVLPNISVKIWEVLSKIATLITIIGITPMILIRKIWKRNKIKNEDF